MLTTAAVSYQNTYLMFEGSIVFLISSTASDKDLNSKVLRSFSAKDWKYQWRKDELCDNLLSGNLYSLDFLDRELWSTYILKEANLKLSSLCTTGTTIITTTSTSAATNTTMDYCQLLTTISTITTAIITATAVPTVTTTAVATVAACMSLNFVAA